jgi:alpha-tubulin suppressor-like RCC1 family protein
MPATNFKFSDQGFTNVDFDDVFVRKEFFLEGGLWSWGYNGFGRLGNNTTTMRSSPAQTVSGGTNWKQISVALGGTTAAIKTDGTLWLWGYGGQGRLGNNSTTNRSSPVQTISSGTNWKQVSVARHTAAIKTDGTLWVWGSAFEGRLGNNSNINRSSPVQTISSGTNWKQVSAGDAVSAAIKTDGTLWLWGCSALLADNITNSTINRSSPVQTISSGTNWKQVAAGYHHAAAIKTDGTLWLWGQNNIYGLLGDNTRVIRSSPVQTVSSGNNWKQVSVNANLTAAIKTDGTLWLWGGNVRGALGNNSNISRSSPVQTVSSGTDWKQVAVSCNHAAAIKTNGTLWLWGYNTLGVLGNNTTITRSSPVQTVSSGTNWRQVCAGFITAAIREECW